LGRGCASAARAALSSRSSRVTSASVRARVPIIIPTAATRLLAADSLSSSESAAAVLLLPGAGIRPGRPAASRPRPPALPGPPLEWAAPRPPPPLPMLSRVRRFRLRGGEEVLSWGRGRRLRPRATLQERSNQILTKINKIRKAEIIKEQFFFSCGNSKNCFRKRKPTVSVHSLGGCLGLTSVADPGCLSRILDPDFYPSRIPDLRYRIPDPGSQIPDPKTAAKERGETKFAAIPFFVAANITKLKIILFLNR
jgi:hypothetical protein